MALFLSLIISLFIFILLEKVISSLHVLNDHTLPLQHTLMSYTVVDRMREAEKKKRRFSSSLNNDYMTGSHRSLPALDDLRIAKKARLVSPSNHYRGAASSLHRRHEVRSALQKKNLSRRRLGLSIPIATKKPPSSCSVASSYYGDRFIPSRRDQNLDMISHSLLAAERRSNELLSGAKHEQDQVDDECRRAVLCQPKPAPIQKAFEREVFVSLHGVAADSSHPTSFVPRSKKRRDCLLSTVSPGLRQSTNQDSACPSLTRELCAYSSLADLEAKHGAGSTQQQHELCILSYGAISREKARSRPSFDPFALAHWQPQQELPCRAAASRTKTAVFNSRPTKPWHSGGTIVRARRDDWRLNTLFFHEKDQELLLCNGTDIHIRRPGKQNFNMVDSCFKNDGLNVITSIEWDSAGGSNLAFGTREGRIDIWDGDTVEKVVELGGHSDRVGTLAWSKTNPNILCSAGRDNKLLKHDIRAKNHVIATYEGHEKEIFAMKWRDDDGCLASAGDDNKAANTAACPTAVSGWALSDYSCWSPASATSAMSFPFPVRRKTSSFKS